MDIKTLEAFKLSDAVKFHNKLNPKLFHNDKLRPEVRRHMLLIAKDFLTDLGIKEVDVKDITLSGSNAAYSYTLHSDIDIHILVDLTNLSNDDIYWELFTAKKTLYNDNHKINIYKIPVELYVQDAAEDVISAGEYSILNNKWIHVPIKRKMTLDHKDVKLKYNKLLEFLKMGMKSRNITMITRITKKIKQYRQAGLDNGGEFSPENIAYKALRNQGYIDKLYKLRDKLNSERLSIEGLYSQTNDTIQIPLGRRGKATATVPRMLYHSLRRRQLDSHGNISGYPLPQREKELEQEFATPSINGYVWLSPQAYTAGAIKIDASKLDPNNIRLTGQSEGFLLHKGSIPASAIISIPITEKR